MAISISFRETSVNGYGIVYGFEVDSEGDVQNLPILFPEAAETSSALVVETYDVYHLRPIGNGQLRWVKGGEKQ